MLSCLVVACRGRLMLVIHSPSIFVSVQEKNYLILNYGKNSTEVIGIFLNFQDLQNKAVLPGVQKNIFLSLQLIYSHISTAIVIE